MNSFKLKKHHSSPISKYSHLLRYKGLGLSNGYYGGVIWPLVENEAMIPSMQGEPGICGPVDDPDC